MDNSPANPNTPSLNLDERLSLIESALKWEGRLSSLETALTSKDKGALPTVPWWRDSKTITILGALIAAVIPLVTAIDGILKNARESQRAIIEHQDKIRQTYLDRVLKSGITEGEQQRIFSLLSRLKSDPEFQDWAKEEYSKAVQKVDELNKEKSSLEATNKELLSQLEAEKLRSSTLSGSQKNQANSRVRNLERQVIQAQRRVSELRERVGEPASINPGLTKDEGGKLRPTVGYRWVNPDDPNDYRVELNPGLIKGEDGTLRPASGYRWANPNDPKDLRVEPIP